MAWLIMLHSHQRYILRKFRLWQAYDILILIACPRISRRRCVPEFQWKPIATVIFQGRGSGPSGSAHEQVCSGTQRHYITALHLDLSPGMLGVMIKELMAMALHCAHVRPRCYAGHIKCCTKLTKYNITLVRHYTQPSSLYQYFIQLICFAMVSYLYSPLFAQ